MTLPYRQTDEGLFLAVRVTPRSSKTRLGGLSVDAKGRPALAIRLAAPPVDGAANQALTDFVARSLDLPRSAVRIEAGETSRNKILLLEGEASALVHRLARWIGETPP